MRRHRTEIRRVAAALLFLQLWLAPVIAGAEPAASVRIQDFRFEPETVEVPVGATVSWVNQDEEIHAIVAVDGGFHSPGLEGEVTYEHQFTAPGTYEYRCALHPQMKGTVVVR